MSQYSLQIAVEHGPQLPAFGIADLTPASVKAIELMPDPLERNRRKQSLFCQYTRYAA